MDVKRFGTFVFCILSLFNNVCLCKTQRSLQKLAIIRDHIDTFRRVNQPYYEEICKRLDLYATLERKCYSIRRALERITINDQNPLGDTSTTAHELLDHIHESYYETWKSLSVMNAAKSVFESADRLSKTCLSDLDEAEEVHFSKLPESCQIVYAYSKAYNGLVDLLQIPSNTPKHKVLDAEASKNLEVLEAIENRIKLLDPNVLDDSARPPRNHWDLFIRCVYKTVGKLKSDVKMRFQNALTQAIEEEAALEESGFSPTSTSVIFTMLLVVAIAL